MHHTIQTMNQQAHPLLKSIIALGVAAGFSSCSTTTTSSVQSDPKQDATLQAMSGKIGQAKTIRVTATHKIHPALNVGSGLDRAPVEITVKRPNQFYSIQQAGAETREISFDGKTLRLMHPTLKHHATKSLSASSVEEFGDRVEAKFGFRPPVAELVSSNVLAQLLRDVTTATVSGVERLEGTKCKRLHFEQPGMTGDVWVSVESNLPIRYQMHFPDVAGNAAWDIRLSKWELDGAVDEHLFTKRPAADSSEVQLLKSK